MANGQKEQQGRNRNQTGGLPVPSSSCGKQVVRFANSEDRRYSYFARPVRTAVQLCRRHCFGVDVTWQAEVASLFGLCPFPGRFAASFCGRWFARAAARSFHFYPIFFPPASPDDVGTLPCVGPLSDTFQYAAADWLLPLNPPREMSATAIRRQNVVMQYFCNERFGREFGHGSSH